MIIYSERLKTTMKMSFRKIALGENPTIHGGNFLEQLHGRSAGNTRRKLSDTKYPENSARFKSNILYV